MATMEITFAIGKAQKEREEIKENPGRRNKQDQAQTVEPGTENNFSAAK